MQHVTLGRHMRNRFAIRIICMVLLALFAMQATGCTSWHTQHVAPKALVESKHPAKLRITRLDGTREIVQNPVYQADTLVGLSPGKKPQHEVRIVDVDVRKVETHGFSVGWTVAAILAVPLGIIAIYAISCASDESNCFSSN